MTMTVRLPVPIESALAEYCVERGVTKSLVVQESLAAYLLDNASAKANAAAQDPQAGASVSANYKAFADAGLIGGVALGQGADKAAVRKRVEDRLAEKKPRRSAS